MARKAQNVRVGLFAVAALFLLGVTLIVFGGLRVWQKSEHYRIVFDGSVYGLEPGADVYLNGVRVGTVGELGVARDDIRNVLVTIDVERGTPIHADTRAILQYAGITGLKVIDLRHGTSASPPLPPGSQIATGKGLLDELQNQAEVLAEQSTELMKSAGEVMRRASVLTDQLISVTEPARDAAQNFAAMSASLKAMAEENRVKLRRSFSALDHTAQRASALLDQDVAPLVGEAGGFIADLRKLLVANEGSLRAAVFDLRQASRNVKELARDIRQRPSRLLFSREPQERKLP